MFHRITRLHELVHICTQTHTDISLVSVLFKVPNFFLTSFLQTQTHTDSKLVIDRSTGESCLLRMCSKQPWFHLHLNWSWTEMSPNYCSTCSSWSRPLKLIDRSQEINLVNRQNEKVLRFPTAAVCRSSEYCIADAPFWLVRMLWLIFFQERRGAFLWISYFSISALYLSAPGVCAHASLCFRGMKTLLLKAYFPSL